MLLHRRFSMKTNITNIEQFISNHFDENSSEYIVTEARILNSFLKRLIDLGFSLYSAHDGEERHKIENNDRYQMLDVIFSVDDSSIQLISNEDEKFSLSIILGNGDATTISDHSDISENLEKLIFSEFAKSVKTHSEELYDLNWCGYAS